MGPKNSEACSQQPCFSTLFPIFKYILTYVYFWESAKLFVRAVISLYTNPVCALQYYYYTVKTYPLATDSLYACMYTHSTLTLILCMTCIVVLSIRCAISHTYMSPYHVSTYIHIRMCIICLNTYGRIMILGSLCCYKDSMSH